MEGKKKKGANKKGGDPLQLDDKLKAALVTKFKCSDKEAASLLKVFPLRRETSGPE